MVAITRTQRNKSSGGHYRVRQNGFTRLTGCGIRNMRPIFKTELLIISLTVLLIINLDVNLDVKTLFGKSPIS